ncbi:ABC transporter permease subunit [Nakamurella sp. YIM 132087]|uniref:ABC transporter permease subunit n=1 Tax=Nakamurella alba TaxID=2665158 RepID=A0A7K1FMW6_9ACTN|nr:ABC transporter permease [Nakamurella alba]MTD15476.1 ABC transporter permease subunit [Nakamurella alba]
MTSTLTPRALQRKDRPARMVPKAPRNIGLVVGIGILGAMAVLGTVVPIVAGYGTVASPSTVLQAPSAGHWFGTDAFGRDIFVRSMAAIQIDLLLAVAVTLVGLAIGSVVGAISATIGGRFDAVVMRLTDILMAFPAFVLALVIAASLGNNALNAAIGVTIAYIPQFVRLTRAQALEIRSRDFVAAARVSGTPTLVVALQHVLPNAFRAPLVQASLIAGWVVLDLAGLSFLGVGVQPPTPEWGQMIAVGSGDLLLGNWWTALFPGLMILLAAAAFQLVGDRLERSIR